MKWFSSLSLFEQFQMILVIVGVLAFLASCLGQDKKKPNYDKYAMRNVIAHYGANIMMGCIVLFIAVYLVCALFSGLL